MKMRARTKVGLLVTGAAGFAALVTWRRGSPHQDRAATELAADQKDPPVEVAAAPPAPLPPPDPRPPRREPAEPPPASAPTEGSLMATLRELGASDPARSLELAREGNRRFPASPAAAERSWTICKSLAALGRSSEAQAEARKMVEQYPDTTWAADVQRHLLSQPLQDPGQRG